MRSRKYGMLLRIRGPHQHLHEKMPNHCKEHAQIYLGNILRNGENLRSEATNGHHRNQMLHAPWPWSTMKAYTLTATSRPLQN